MNLPAQDLPPLAPTPLPGAGDAQSLWLQQALAQQHRLAQVISRAQARFIADTVDRTAFEGLLEDLLGLTQSAFGFVGEVLLGDTGQPYIRTHAITDITWDNETRTMLERSMPGGLEFHNLSTLFGAALRTREAVISNAPLSDPRRGGLPSGHPPLLSFLGLPVLMQGQLVAMVGLANREGGYANADVDFLQPLLATVAQLVAARRAELARQQVEAELRAASDRLAEKTLALKVTLENMAQGIATFGPDGRLGVYNQRFATLLDLPEPVLCEGATMQSIVNFQRARGDHGENLDYFEPAVRAAAAQAKAGALGNYVRKTRAGGAIEVKSRRLPDGSMVCTYSDISAHLQTNESLKAERQRLDWILQGTRAGTWEWNLETGSMIVNERWTEMLGYRTADLSPLTREACLQLVHADDRALSDAKLRKHLDGATDFYECDLRIRHRDGHWVWVVEGGRVHTRSADGRPLWMAGTQIDCSERKQTEAQLRETSTALQATFDSMTQGIVHFGADGHVKAYNPRLLALVDIPESLLAASPSLEEVAQFQAARGDFGENLEGVDDKVRFDVAAHVSDMPSRYVRRTHHGRILEVHTQWLEGKSFVRTFTDITAYMEVSDRLNAERERLAEILDGTRAGTWGRNVPAGEEWVDERWADIVGYSLKELQPFSHQVWRNMMAPDDLVRAETLYQRHLDGLSEYYECDFRMRHKAGHWVWVLARARVQARAADGQPLKVSGIHLDISEIKRVEDALKEASTKLMAQGTLLQTTLSSISQGIMMVGADARLNAFNRRACELLELPYAFLSAKPTLTEMIQLQIARGDFGDTLQWVQSDGRAHLETLGDVQAPAVYVRRTRNQRFLEVKTQALSGGGMVRTFSDVTDYVQARDALKQLNDSLERRVEERTADLERSMRDMETISYSIAHDLRAPLRTVNGFAVLLEEKEAAVLSDDSRRMLGRIASGARSMGLMIDDLLDLFRVAKAELVLHPVDMQALLDDVLHTLGAQRARVQVGALPAARGDVTLLRQVLANLLDNAVKYSGRAAEPQVQVGFDAVQQAYFVADNGVGFDMQHADKLFGVFQRLQTEFPGSGVGLAIVARIVERHGGTIWAQSSPGQGARFLFTLNPG